MAQTLILLAWRGLCIALVLSVILALGACASDYRPRELYLPCERWSNSPAPVEVARERGVFMVIGCR